MASQSWWLWSCCCADVDEGKSNFVSLKPAQDPLTEGFAQVHDAIMVAEQDSWNKAFAVDISKRIPHAPLGLHLDLADGQVLHVCGVRPGDNPVTRYNAVVAKDRQIMAGDYIKAINGISGSAAALAEAVLHTSRLHLVVQRPYCFGLQVDRSREPLGLDLNFSEKGTSLVITDIGPGAILRRGSDVRRHDRILMVNGVAGKPDQLLTLIKTSPIVDLLISRCL